MLIITVWRGKARIGGLLVGHIQRSNSFCFLIQQPLLINVTPPVSSASIDIARVSSLIALPSEGLTARAIADIYAASKLVPQQSKTSPP